MVCSEDVLKVETFMLGGCTECWGESRDIYEGVYTGFWVR